MPSQASSQPQPIDVSDEVEKANYAPNIHPSTDPDRGHSASSGHPSATPGGYGSGGTGSGGTGPGGTGPGGTGPGGTGPGETAPAGATQPAGNRILAALFGASFSISFYSTVLLVPWGPLRRYFLGHPVAIAATCLFFFALGVLIAKLIGMVAQSNQLAAIRDIDLCPPQGDDTPAGRWMQQNDAAHVAKRWLAMLSQLPRGTRDSQLVQRLSELLHRQSQRGTTRHLADDLREIATRDADAVHDSYGFIRIVVWAIPMLGFLGTVIGITQTLGGLDFSNGTAAVDSLKTGLYVAFDTTALGLVLSVIAIFIQFPIEQHEQRLLSTVDARIGNLVSSCLPSDEASENQTALIAELCSGVQAAVAESLDRQGKLWRETIDEARNHWQSAHDQNNNHFAEALKSTLLPALADHAVVISESAKFSAQRIDRQWQRCEEAIHYQSDTLSSQQLELISQFETLSDVYSRAGSVIALQRALQSNLEQLDETNRTIQQSIESSASSGMADAMRILARAVDVLSDHLADVSVANADAVSAPRGSLARPRRAA